MENRIETTRLKSVHAEFARKLPLRLQDIRSLWDKLLYVKWDPEVFALVYRLVHSLAGSAATFGYVRVGENAARADELMRALREREDVPPTEQERTRISALIEALVTQSDVEPPTEQAEAKDVASPVGISVYLLEDEVELGQYLRIHLQRAGFDVSVFTTRDALLAAALDNAPDALVCDVMLPGDAMAGIHAAEAVREQLAKPVPVLFMSARGDLSARLQAIRAGGNGYLTKPIDVQSLIRKLHTLTQEDQSDRYRVLILAQEEEQGAHISWLLQKSGIEGRALDQPLNLLQELQAFVPDLILMDFQLPECSGLELAPIIRQEDRFANIPILFLTQAGRVEEHTQALQCGADGCVSKPINAQDLVVAVSSRVERARSLSKRVQYLSHQDAATGLLNRRAFMAELHRTTSALLGHQSNTHLALVDVGHVREIAERASVSGADLVLSDVAKALRRITRGTTVLSRFGDHSFALIVPADAAEKPGEMAQRMMDELSGHLYEVGGRSFPVNFCIGVAPWSPGLKDADAWLTTVMLAGDAARKKGENRYHVQRPQDDREAEREFRSRCVDAVAAALEGDGFRQVYQPIAGLRGDSGERYDVLLRLRDTFGKELEPAQFLPAAEAAGVGAAVDRWVLEKAIETIAQRQAQGKLTQLFVKLGESSVQDESFVERLIIMLAGKQIQPGSLVLEMAEQHIVDHLRGAQKLIREVRILHCGVALEHFGAGLGGSQLLERIKVDYLKIDSGFMHNLGMNKANQDGIRRVVDLAARANARVIAGFVEDPGSLAALWDCGVHYIQGNFLQEPDAALSFDFSEESFEYVAF